MADPDDVQKPDAAVPDAVAQDVPDLDIPAADVPELDQSDPVVPEAVLPESFLTEPVIPPPPPDTPVTGADWRESWQDHAPAQEGAASDSAQSDSAVSSASPVTRAARRTASGIVGAPAAPASDPRLTAPEPAPTVVPPPDGATGGGYRVLTAVIYGFLGVLLVGAVVTIGVLVS
ncbi:hypothetical protein Q9R19_09890 [Microbacterium sp. ARD32]|uniref:hypothetical protein n=1 Tax=Microbacterium sp. ARD32 TaxID=2962577 RepID=UPI002881A437|nr:hypothetical protein [Microbacterium sp. ARD32]MDT0157933.1 hypothetical protein [Microbacterium sp. ARD32]